VSRKAGVGTCRSPAAASQAEPIVERARADAHRDGQTVGRDPEPRTSLSDGGWPMPTIGGVPPDVRKRARSVRLRMRSMNVLAVVPVTMSKRRGSGRRACRPERGQHVGPMGTVKWIGLDGCRRVDAGIGGYPADQHAADRSPGGWVPPSRARAPLAAAWDFEEIGFRRQRLEHRADREVDR